MKPRSLTFGLAPALMALGLAPTCSKQRVNVGGDDGRRGAAVGYLT